MVGIIIALVLRGIFILLGAQLIASFSWIFYIFGAFLALHGDHQAFEQARRRARTKENGFIRFMRNASQVSDSTRASSSAPRSTAAGMFTPLIIVFIALGTTDLLFALDSIPAIFGITQSPFIVFTANVFALMGLRQLYFLLGDLLDKLEYLKYGIAFILAFIGVKLVFHAMHENELPFINGGEHDRVGARHQHLGLAGRDHRCDGRCRPWPASCGCVTTAWRRRTTNPLARRTDGRCAERQQAGRWSDHQVTVARSTSAGELTPSSSPAAATSGPRPACASPNRGTAWSGSGAAPNCVPGADRRPEHRPAARRPRDPRRHSGRRRRLRRRQPRRRRVPRHLRRRAAERARRHRRLGGRPANARGVLDRRLRRGRRQRGHRGHPGARWHPDRQVLVEAEALLRERAPGAVLLRLSGVYGPGRERLIDQVRSGPRADSRRAVAAHEPDPPRRRRRRARAPGGRCPTRRRPTSAPTTSRAGWTTCCGSWRTSSG